MRRFLVFSLLLCLCLVIQDTPPGLAALPAPLGWHHDAFSRYPDATPVMSWAPDEQVVWSVPTPNWGNASPILAGDRLFITAEPTTLLCLNAADGAIRWQRTNGYEDLLSAEDAAKLADEWKQQEEIGRQVRPLQREFREKQKELEKTPDDAALKAALQDIDGQLTALQKQLDALPLATQWKMPNTNPENGYASPTPACDGERLYAAFGNGIVVCYDLDGNQQWRRFLEKPTHGWGHGASPLLAGDILIIQYNTNVYGLNAKTGETTWQGKSPFEWGSPALARIGAIEAVITPGGVIFNAPDGKELGKIPVRPLEYNVPLVDGDIVYWVQGETAAIKLAPKEDGTLDAEVLWKTRIKNDRYYASPLLHDGLLYAVMRFGTMSVLDAKDGTLVYEHKLDAGGENYASFILAGNVIFLFHDSGKTLVLEPGREYKELARNTLERVRATPVCREERMYVRGKSKMWCLGE
jgi:outer membrane protein assembly factor BamB